MKTIIWKDSEKLIPGYGRGYPGCLLNVPDDMAQSFVDQGKAEFPASKSVQQKKKLVEDK